MTRPMPTPMMTMKSPAVTFDVLTSSCVSSVMPTASVAVPAIGNAR